MILKTVLHVENLLKQNEKFVDKDGNVFVQNILEAIEKIDKDLVKLLISDEKTREQFFIKIDDIFVLEQNKLIEFFTMNEYFNNSFTSYTNKIGLIKKDSFIKKFDDVVLAWPHKDCILEGGQSKDDDKKNEVFYNEILSRDEIDRLFEPKALTNIKRYTKEGVEENPQISEDDNLIIKGNNLIALHSLKKKYAGKVKLIYIDPPYYFSKKKPNDSFTYNSNFKLSTWLTFMKNRLEIAREFLQDEGVIFVSIDDGGQAYLKVLMDEVFQSDNFIANLPTIMNLKGNNDEFGFSGTHEYTVVYAKNKINCKLYEFDIDEKNVDEWEEDEKGYFKKGANLKATGVDAPRNNRQLLYFPILIKEDKIFHITDDEYKKIYDASSKVFNDAYVETLKTKYEADDYTFLLPITRGEKVRWRWQRKKMIEDEYDIIVSNDSTIYKKQRPMLGELPSKKPKTIFYKPEYSSGNGTAEIKSLFGEKVFSNPKPLQLMKDIVKIGCKDGIVMDFYAGSGTTAQAVLDLNKKDGGNRKFILIEQMDYIEDITCKRVEKVIEKNQEGSFIYAELKQIDTFKDAEIGKLNANMHYLPVAEIEDIKYKISEEEIKINKQFYGLENE